MRWPWTKPEQRDSSYTDTLVAYLQSAAGNNVPGDPSGLAALEAAAGLYSAAFAAARVEGPEILTTAFTPALRALIAHELIRQGEAVLMIQVDRDGVRLLPAGYWDIRGGYDPADWRIRCDLFGPSGHISRHLPYEAVLHFKFQIDPARPWRGVSPLQFANLTGALAGNLEKRLGEEAGAPVGAFLPLPSDGGTTDADGLEKLATLRADIAGARGRQIVVKTSAGGYDMGKSGAPQKDFSPNRFGADPPDALKMLRDAAGEAVMNACQVPEALFSQADGTSQREAWRRWAMGPLRGLAATVETELALKLDAPLRFDFSGLWAHDAAGRASAFKALTAGGMDIERAVGLSGVLTPSDPDG